MSCLTLKDSKGKVITAFEPTGKKESILYNELVKVYGDEEYAHHIWSLIYSSEFSKTFGDWLHDIETYVELNKEADSNGFIALSSIDKIMAQSPEYVKKNQEAFDYVSNLSKIFSKILDNDNVPIEYINDHKNMLSYKGAYDRGKILINSNVLKNKDLFNKFLTVIHEMFHAFTANNTDKLNVDFLDLNKKLKEYAKSFYTKENPMPFQVKKALEYPSETLAYAFNSKQYMDFLSKIPYDTSNIKINEVLMDSIYKYANIKRPSHKTALDYVINKSIEYASENKDVNYKAPTHPVSVIRDQNLEPKLLYMASNKKTIDFTSRGFLFTDNFEEAKNAGKKHILPVFLYADSTEEISVSDLRNNKINMDKSSYFAKSKDSTIYVVFNSEQIYPMLADVDVTTASKDDIIKSSKSEKLTETEKARLRSFVNSKLNIPIYFSQRLENIFDNGRHDALAVFYKNAIFMTKNAGLKEGFHEALHAAFKLYLTPEERKSILEDARENYNFKGSDIDVEEQIADLYSELLLTDKVPEPKNKKSKSIISKILSDLYKFIQSLFRVNSTSYDIETLFDNITNGRFRGKSFASDYNENEEYIRYKLPGFDPVESKRALDYVRYIFTNQLRLISKQAKFKDKNLSEDQILESVGIANIVNLIVNHLYKVKTESKNKTISENNDRLIKIMLSGDNYIVTEKGGIKITKYNPSFFKAFFRDISQYGFNYTFSGTEKDTLAEEEEADEMDDLFGIDTTGVVDVTDAYMIRDASRSTHKTAPAILKRFLSDIPLLDEDENVILSDEYGQPLYENGVYAFSYIQKHVHDMNSESDMMSRLEELKPAKPYIAEVIKRLNQKENYQLKSSFFTNIAAKTFSKFYKVKQIDNEIRLFSINRANVENTIIADWRADFDQNPNLFKNNKIDVEYAKDKKEKYDELVSNVLEVQDINSDTTLWENRKKQLKELSKLTRDLGIHITPEMFKSITNIEIGKYVKRSKPYSNLRDLLVGKNGLSTLLSAVSNGRNPFSDGHEETTSLNKVAGVIKETYDSAFQSSVLNGDNNLMFSHGNSSYFTELISDLKNPIESENVIRSLQEDPFYETSPLLNYLLDPDSRDVLEYGLVESVEINESTKTYSNMSSLDLAVFTINAYHNQDRNTAFYVAPIPGDSSRIPLIKFHKFSIDKVSKDGVNSSEVLNALYDAVLQEYNRIENTKKQLEKVKAGKGSIFRIKNILDDKERGLKFWMFPFMNKHLGKLDFSDKQKVIDIIESYVESEFENQLRDLNEIGFIKDGYSKSKKTGDWIVKIENNAYADRSLRSGLGKKLLSFFYNDMLMQSQFISVFSGDLAFYKSTDDFFKRMKQMMSPGLQINTNGKFIDEDTGEIITVSNIYNTVYINDITVENKLDTLREALESLGTLSKKQINEIVNEWSDGSTVTDGQGYIDLYRYREIMIGAGRWNQRYQKAFKILMTGEKLPNEFSDLSFQPIKPFYFSIQKDFVNKQFVPTQNKNSEVVLLPSMAKNNKDLRAILEKMGYTFHKNKVSPKSEMQQALVDSGIIEEGFSVSFDIKNRQTDSVQFNSTVKVGEYKTMPFDTFKSKTLDRTNDLHSLKNSSFKLQVETPPKFSDKYTLFGTQWRKLLMSDLDMDNNSYMLDGFDKPMSGKEIMAIYQDVVNREAKEGFDAVARELGFKYNENGILKYENSKESFESLVNKLRKEVEERNLGDNFLEALEIVGVKETKLPFYHPLHSKRIQSILHSFFKKGVTKHKIFGGSFINLSRFGFEDSLEVKISEDHTGKKRVEYVEALLPYWSKKGMGKLMDQDGVIQIDKLPPELRNAIVFRIPSEDKYSVVNIKVKGFTSREAGGIVVLPSEITTMAGLDFDIDKMFAMFYEFDFVNGEFIKVPSGMEASEELQEKFKNKPEKLHRANTRARNNLLLDISRAVLMSSASTESILNPGNFSHAKKLAEKLIAIKRHNLDINPILPSTRLEIFKRITTGKSLIGVFANHNTNHALLQHYDVELPFNVSFNGISNKKLNLKKTLVSRKIDSITETIEGDYRISKILASLLAAVVDNAKEPISNYLNLNLSTANTYALIIRAGFDLDTAVAFMNQPYIEELTDILRNGVQYNAFSDIDTFLNQKVEKLKKDFNLSDEQVEELNLYGDNNLNVEDLWDEMQTFNENRLEDVVYQIKVLSQFDYYYKMAKELGDLVAITKTDTVSSGPTSSHNNLFISRKNKFFNTSRHSKYQLKNTAELFSANSKIPMINGFYQYGIKKPVDDVLSEFLPFSSELFYQARERTIGSEYSASDSETVNFHLMSFLATKYDFYDRKFAKRMTYDFPKEFYDFKLKNKDKYPLFLNNLQYQSNKSNGLPFDTISFRGSSGMSPEEKQYVIVEWEKMSKSKSFSERSMAWDLMRYTFYMSGFNFTPSSFYNLIPPNMMYELGRESDESFNDFLNKYFSKAKNLTEEEFRSSLGDFSNEANDIVDAFSEQFIRHRFDKQTTIAKSAMDVGKNKNVQFLGRINGQPAFFRAIENHWISESGTYPKWARYKDQSEDSNGEIYLFKNINGTPYYEVVDPLGIGIYSLEYDANVKDIKSMHSRNRMHKSKKDFVKQYKEQKKSSVEQVKEYAEKEKKVKDLVESTEPVKEVVKVSKFTRKSASQDTDYLYLFTDNAGRTSGKNKIDPNSRYVEKFGQGNYPNMTQAVLRGLDNSAPITTMVDDKKTQWTTGRFEEFKEIIDGEIEYIQNELSSGKYKGIKYNADKIIGRGTYSKLPEKLQNYLDEKLAEIGIDNTTDKNQLKLFSLGNTINFNKLNEEFKTKMLGILSEAGWSVNHIEELETKYGIDAAAVTDFINKEVNLSEESEDIDFLEEFAHVVTAGLGHDHPLIKRARELVKDTDLYNEVKEEYKDVYTKEVEFLQEAVDKGLRDVMSKDPKIMEQSFSQRLKNLLNRILDLFKKLVLRVNKQQLNNELESIYKEILDPISRGEEIYKSWDFTNVKRDVMMSLKAGKYKTSQILSGHADNLKKLMDITRRRLEILSYREGDISNKQADSLIRLQKDLEENRVTYGIVKVVNEIGKDLNQALNEIRELSKLETLIPLHEFARKLNKVHGFNQAYKPILEELKSENTLSKFMFLEKDNIEYAFDTTELEKELYNEILENLNNINSLELAYSKYSEFVVANVYWKHAKNNPKYNNDINLFIKDIKTLDKDISIFRYLLDSMAESGDAVLGAIDRYMKDYKLEAFFDADKDVKELLLVDEKLKKAGVKDYRFAFDTNEDGSRNGNMISEYKEDELEKVLTEGFEKIEKKYFGDDYATMTHLDKFDFFESKENASKKKQYYRERYRFYDKHHVPADNIDEIKDRKKQEFIDRYVTSENEEYAVIQRRTAFKEYHKWLDKNEYTNPVTKRKIYRYDLAKPHDRYKNKKWSKLVSDAAAGNTQAVAKLEYLNKIYELKDKFMKYLPTKDRHRTLAPQLRKDWMESIGTVLSKGGFKDAYNEFVARVKDTLILNEQDVNEYGDLGGVLKDPLGNEVDFIPVQYVKRLTKKITDENGEEVTVDDMEDLSWDLTTGMGLMIEMAHNFKQMNEISGVMSLTDEVLSNRAVSTDRGVIKRMVSKKLEGFDEFISDEKAHTKEKGGLAYRRFNEYLQMVFYGKMKAEEKWANKIGINGGKLIDTFNKYVAIQNLALNIYAGLANPILGNALIGQEVFARQFLDKENVMYAMLEYSKGLPSVLRDLGNLNSTSKMRLFGERNDLMQDFKEKLHGLDAERSKVGRAINTNSFFFISKAGEHQMRFVTALAMADRIKVKDKNGNEINYYDAFEVVDNTLKLKDGVTDLDGNKITRDFEKRFMLKVSRLNQKLHGIYNDIDRNVMQRHALGRMVMMFRKWMKPGWNRRFDHRRYDYQLETEDEGYYFTFMKFMQSLVYSRGQFMISLKTAMKEVEQDPIKLANMKRMIVEIEYVLALFALSTTIATLQSNDDDDFAQWALNMSAYQLRRFNSELAFYRNPNELLRLAQSPAAGINQMQDLFNVFLSIDARGYLANGEHFFRKYKGGKNKDQTYFRVWLERTIPLYDSLEDWMHPSDKLQFYTN